MIVVAIETILAGNYEFLIYQNVCIYKLGWSSVNTLARVFNCIPLERAGHQQSLEVCGICITAIKIYGPVCDNIHIKCDMYYTFSLIVQRPD